MGMAYAPWARASDMAGLADLLLGAIVLVLTALLALAWGVTRRVTLPSTSPLVRVILRTVLTLCVASGMALFVGFGFWWYMNGNL